jgi:superfamily II DNA/RNA helicase
MIFSATVPAFIQELAKERLKDPILIDLVGDDTTQVPERIVNKAIVVKDQQSMMNHVKSFIESNRDKKVIIFTETKQTARDFEKFTYANFLTLHGDLEQGQRENRLNRYREKSSKNILVATDVAARGLDIDDIDVVI